MNRILFSFTSLFAIALAQNKTWSNTPGNFTKQARFIPSVTCAHKYTQIFGKTWGSTYFNDWGIIQKTEMHDSALQLRQIVTCQDKTTFQLIGIQGAIAQVNMTDPTWPIDKNNTVYPLRDHGFVSANSADKNLVCSMFQINYGEYIESVGVVHKDIGITSINFYTSNGGVFGVGRPGAANETDYIHFESTDQLIGFYGTANPGTNITTIGFLAYKEECRKYTPGERALAITGSVFLTILLLVLIILCCCGVPICGVYIGYKKKPELFKKIKIPISVKQLTQMKKYEDKGKVLPDTSYIEDLEMTDNNLGDRSAIMTDPPAPETKNEKSAPEMNNEKPVPEIKNQKPAPKMKNKK